MSEGQRRLAAIMFTDMVGYTALGQKNESLSLALVEEQRRVIRPILGRHNGREVKTIGDAFLVEFPNAVDAIRCAYDIQRAVREFNFSLEPEKRIHLRVGVHVGEVVESQGDISGDAVNVASRIEPLAEDGGVCVTHRVYDLVHTKVDLGLSSIGFRTVKNVMEPVEVYKLVMPWDKTTTPEAPAAVPAAVLEKKRIAVLPFTHMSSDPEEGYFADGMTEEIITSLSGVKQLMVIARTSVMKYKGSQKGVSEVAKELNVGTLLEGSVRKAGNRVRITAQLIDTSNESHLWAQNYDRTLEDVFAIQSEIAEKVAGELKVQLLGEEARALEKKPTQNMEAYSLYLKGRYLWNKRGMGDVKKAAELFEQAVKKDQRFALGYVGIADCCLYDPSFQESARIDEGLKKADMMVAKALELDTGLAEAHATKGEVLMAGYKPRQAEEEYRKAIGLNPNFSYARLCYSYFLMTQLRWDEALEQGERAVELDPLSVVAILDLLHVCFHVRDFGRALGLAKRAASLDPGYPWVHFFLMLIHVEMNMPEEARRAAAVWVELVQGDYPLARMGADFTIAVHEKDKETVARLVPECTSHFLEAGLSAWFVAVGLFCIGEKDKGFDWLERSYSRREPLLMEIKNEQSLNTVRTDQRYLDLLKRLGLD